MWKRSANPRRRHAPGTSPGTLTVDPGALAPSLEVIAYGPEELTVEAQPTQDRLRALLESQPVTWLNVDGLGSSETIESIGRLFGLHPLALEDVLNVEHRPKVESYGDFYFIIARMSRGVERSDTEQVSVFLGRKFVVTFQERSGDCLDPIRDRLRSGRVRIRNSGADYLAYAIIDTIVDAFFPVVESFSDRLEDLEREILADPRQEAMVRLRHIKRELLTLRRAIWPLREALSSLTREESDLVTGATQIFLRDCYDHVVQLNDLIESQREFSTGLMDLYMSSISNRMNEVMKVLTMIATLFIPLSFVAGLYGMNFDTASPWNLPELGWRYGYPFALGLMAGISVLFVIFFKRKGWFG